MKLKQTILALFLFTALTSISFGQSNDLNIFGYFQTNFTHFNVYSRDVKTLDINSFLMQQMNVFFQKNINTEFSAFVNLEFTNSYSSKDSIGGLKVQEAWLKYSPSQYLNVKAGVLIPRFNNFNEIKNRTVLMPYIYRPIAYETYFFDQFGTGEFVPTAANIQVYGNIPAGDLYLNYAAYYGNSETSMLNNNKNFWGPGQDPTPYKLAGGRIGAEYDNLQLGVSATVDKKNLDKSSSGFGMVEYNLGYITRTRFGAYLNYSFSGFEFEGELIKVNYDLSDANKAQLAANPMGAQSFDKTYYHINLLYNFTGALAAYAGYDYLKGEDNIFIADGLNIYTCGASYRATDAVLLKVQYDHHVVNMSGLPLTRNDYLVGASVSF